MSEFTTPLAIKPHDDAINCLIHSFNIVDANGRFTCSVPFGASPKQFTRDEALVIASLIVSSVNKAAEADCGASAKPPPGMRDCIEAMFRETLDRSADTRGLSPGFVQVKVTEEDEGCEVVVSAVLTSIEHPHCDWTDEKLSAMMTMLLRDVGRKCESLAICLASGV